MSDHDELESSVAPWVLGALDDDEAEATRIHVEGCPTCRATVARLRRVVAAVPLAVDEVELPARLRERVLGAAAASRGSAPPSGRAAWRVAAAAPGSRRPLFARLQATVPAYAAAAGLLLALVVGLVAGDLVGRPPASQVARFTLAGHGDLAGARATVVDLKTEGVALVDFSGLPALDSGRVYEVWLITTGGRADPAAVFVPDSNGAKVVLVNHSLGGYSEMAVTNEAGPSGAKSPTQQPKLYGNVA
jgi:anti-sigma-K factor RskA